MLHLNSNYSNLKEANDIDDPLYYIKEKKILIKFVNLRFKIYNVKIPISIDKKDLYSIALDYADWHGSKILLVYMNCILNEDESSIKCISDGDMIIIIENNYYNDDTYLNLLVDKNQNTEKINLSLYYNDKFFRNLIISKNITISQIYKALLLNFGLNFNFRYKGKLLEENDNNIMLEERTIINICSLHSVCQGLERYGKTITIEIKAEKQDNSECFVFGTLNSLKTLIKAIEERSHKKVQKFFFDKKEIKIGEEDRSLSSLGINHDCSCFIVFEKDKNN